MVRPPTDVAKAGFRSVGFEMMVAQGLVLCDTDGTSGNVQ